MYTIIQCIIMCPSIYCDVCILKIEYNAICVLLYNMLFYMIQCLYIIYKPILYINIYCLYIYIY